MADVPTGTTTNSSGTNPPGRTPPPQHRIEIKNADAVQDTLLGGINWIEDNARVVVAVIVVAIVLGIAYAAYTGIRNHQEKVAQDEFYKVEAPFLKKRDAFEKSKFKAFMPPQADDKTPSETSTGDLAKDYGPLITAVESSAHQYEGTAAGGQAALLAAQTYLDYKNPDKALEYAQLAAKLSKDTTIGALGRVMVGNVYAAKNDCAGAVKPWQEVLDTPSASYLTPDVNLRTGVCLEKLGQNDRAAEAYRKAAAAGDSPAAASAKGLLRALELKNPSVAGLSTNTAPTGKAE